GRPLELGRALGAMVRELRSLDGGQVEAALRENGLDARAASNLRAYLDEQAEATGAIPDDRTIVIERFADEIGDWRVCILTPFGSRVHAPWAMAIEERLERNDLPVQVLWSDDGIILRLPEALDSVATELLLPGWIAVYMYEGDAPLAERRAAALALDRDLLRDLMGAEELRELLDPAVLEQLELELQRLVPERHARHADDLHDLLADLGPCS